MFSSFYLSADISVGRGCTSAALMGVGVSNKLCWRHQRLEVIAAVFYGEPSGNKFIDISGVDFVPMSLTAFHLTLHEGVAIAITEPRLPV